MGFSVSLKPKFSKMPPKVKKDPNAPVLCHDDVFERGRRFIDLKVAPKPPKGELTEEEFNLPPSVMEKEPDLN